MSAPATYGELMLGTEMGIRHGVVWMQNLPLERREFAETAINDFRDVLRALKEHTWVLLDTRRVQGITEAGAPDPRERAAVRLGEALDEIVGPTPPWAWVGATISPSPWANAAKCVRAATELVSTHSDAAGLPRTPDLDAILRESAARQAGLAGVGDLTATLLAGADHLALRAGQADLPWPEVRRLLPDMGEAQALARDVAGLGSLPTWLQLDDLTVAHPPIRTGEPAAEFADRLGRLRLIAWENARSPHPSVDTLKTYATLGVAVHAHALAFHGLPPATLRTQPQVPRNLAPLANRGRAWQDVSRAIFSWRSAEPGDPVVAEDFARVSGLLRSFAPMAGAQPDLSVADGHHLADALTSASKTTTEIGRWNRTTVLRMGAANQIYIPAQILTGSQVTETEALVEAKIQGRYVPASDHFIDTASTLYRRTAPKKDPALSGPSGLSLRVEPLPVGPAASPPGHDPIARST
ncbi:hypothetical protein [Pengzhenrongella frigida]|uniref:Uncharacterized protein n=1 Tax=Pengzhenrongella frigida TaxID=1259133 RepID=A0A4Q5MVC2_9MICO|nr:hypothetical protein [Cellulomonas sp. HLT2-17]RYV49542.1 hypothetical protein EUA98_18245 [Cellulomonas sp. HLT2-17]